ncbi:MAG: hypothetical protein JWO72_2366 [Caulobacteraceae bacterium]|nr:hypothetical protein [Caulobacteraceae bacterium]
MFRNLARWAGRRLIRYLDQPVSGYAPFSAPPREILRRALKPGDVLLIEGDSRMSAIIKYLTQSTWSHAALYVGDALAKTSGDTEACVLIEALAEQGVIAVPLSKYAHFNTRVCRPVGLNEDQRRQVVAFAVSYLGRQYDLRYVLDLIRYLVPYPPVPVALRRRMLGVGSGDPTRAICSTMIAQAFHSIGYPILPDPDLPYEATGAGYAVSPYVAHETLLIRSEGLFTPRDFDISPYFEVVKPSIESGFNFRRWSRTKPRWLGFFGRQARPDRRRLRPV